MMQLIKQSILTSLFILIFTFTNAQEKEKVSFFVNGNCEMCKANIEDALRIKGVSRAEWNQQTKQVSIVFKPEKIKLEELHKLIAASGYDTDLVKAADSVYNALPDCCRYERTAALNPKK